ncbi:phosphate/phosphite/phosphonate ABC transporter substrate-binding protein [Thiohalocapsa marina]|uniref:Phosphate/phosphite/phosphonate ABC transporter substrate-binding protein n=1 Tax=Thiohalocapsa marina TaxID=424902 RepID=A0A5M8FVC4_9GAMM|nr:phosphate/phosphite/phosphonate ABC transporter substrate-binding protein [Thiohalocapsa marina]KAA6187760.1 phosphate/phosphite/phosphonate ABC transporter substrate-binding protein [Thiohalocapsa marina]
MTRQVSTLVLTLALGCSLTLALVGVAAAEEPPADETYSFGIVPQQSASKLARDWAPLLTHLQQALGVELRFRTAPDIPEFERRLAAGEYDFAYMNPYHYTVFSRAPGYRAFARVADTRIRGILVVRADSAIESLHDLDGASIAFPAPAAFAASVLMRSDLKAQGIGFTPKYVSSHDSVYRAVAKGLYPAGGGVVRTLQAVEPDIREQLRILWTTEGYTPHAFAAHPRVPEDRVAALTAAMVALAQSETGRERLAPLRVEGFEPAADADWDDVRALRIDLLEDLLPPAQ